METPSPASNVRNLCYVIIRLGLTWLSMTFRHAPGTPKTNSRIGPKIEAIQNPSTSETALPGSYG